MAILPQPWELIEQFKAWCQSRGWKAPDREDWIKINDEYHNFLWIQTIHPSTFEKIAMNSRCAIREGNSYRVVDVPYTAWLCSKSLPELIANEIAKKPKLLKKNAIYDLSQAYLGGEPVCLKLNETDSVVFQEFESFLEKERKLKLKQLQSRLILRAPA
jgi:hypothetical protein